MSSIIIEKINIGVVGEITLGSDMTKDLLLPCFSFSLQIIQWVILYFFSEAAVGRSSSRKVFLKILEHLQGNTCVRVSL